MHFLPGQKCIQNWVDGTISQSSNSQSLIGDCELGSFVRYVQLLNQVGLKQVVGQKTTPGQGEQHPHYNQHPDHLKIEKRGSFS